MKLPILVLSIISSLYAGEVVYSAQKDIQEGKHYLKQHQINLAIAAFERVLIYKPNNEIAKFYLGKVWEKKDIKLAIKYFKSIKNPTPAMKLEIDKFLALHKPKLKFNLFLKTGVSYDSNIDNNSNSNSWVIYNDNNQIEQKNTNSDISASSLYELLSITPYYDTNTNLLNTFTIYNKNVNNHANKNIQLFNYNFSYIQTKNKYNFTHSFKYDYIRYANDAYLNIFGLNEKVKFKIKDNYYNTSNISLSYNKYFQDSTQNYHQFNLDSKITKIVNKGNIYLDLGFEDAIKDKNTINPSIAYKTYKIKIGTKKEINQYYLLASVEYKLKNYKDYNEDFHQTQQDNTFDYKLSFNKNGYFIYQLQTEYTTNNSNIDPYSYDKYIVSFNLIKTFKGL